ncbi:MAG TPA: DNA repair protein RecN [Syntrophomonadaceae bacterium]|nr:DNA repair protein RecN [Syntrophomonadaceae bacterium]
MLQEIYISNFVLIEELRMQFNRGLNVLTGETGAGKSIIIDALGLVIGDRLKSDLIRDDQKKAVVEAVFDISNQSEISAFLEENGILSEDNNLIISREILPSGRSLARVNGRNINVSPLKKLTEYLLDMHLQHDHLNILKAENYIDYVDNFASDIDELLVKIQDLYNDIRRIKNKIEEMKTNEDIKLQRIDFLNYQINEIKMAELTLGEEEELTSLASRVRNAKNIIATATITIESLYSSEGGLSAYDQIATAIEAIDNVDDDFLQSFLPTLNDMSFSLQDIAKEISGFRDSLVFEPNLLDEIEDRLHLIGRLKSKYGPSIEAILEHYNKAKIEWEELTNSATTQTKLEDELAVLHDEYSKIAENITQKRKEAALILGKIVNEELSQLNMPHLKFAVAVEPANKPTSQGLDVIDFLFSPNPGEPLRSISKIASGGEISRFVLALKISLTEVYNIPTFIFDEIDVGVGGTSLSAMAKKLGELAEKRQVILVTHSPQVASYANSHFLIEKYVEDNLTYTTVNELNYNEKIKELARMLGGENYTEITLKHAGEMLDQA